MTPTGSTRFKSVLGIVAGLDVLIGLHAALAASVVAHADTSSWQWFTWLGAVLITTLVALSVAAPLAAWCWRGGSQGVRLPIAISPIVLAILIYLIAVVLGIMQNL